MSVSTRIRFEVFKRDGFRCRYCGRGRDTDGVKLHVDHVLPVAAGGGNERDNLVTACQDCNLGKAAKLLDERAPVADLNDRVAAMRTQREKLREYAREKELEEADTTEVWNYWLDVWGEESLPGYKTPGLSSLRRYVSELGVQDVKEAMEITAEKFRYVNNDAVKYLYGVLRNKLADAEGRLKRCTYCRQRIILDPGEDTTAEWHHVPCKEKADAEAASAALEPAEASTCHVCDCTLAEHETYLCDPCSERLGEQYRRDEAQHLADVAAAEDEIDLEVRAWDQLAEAAGF